MSRANFNYTTVTDLIHRLPLSKQLSEKQQILINLEPHWAKLISAFNSQLPNSETRYANYKAVLSNYESGTLTVVCSDALIAGQIKHRQNELVNSLNCHIDTALADQKHASENSAAAQITLDQYQINRLVVKVNPNVAQTSIPHSSSALVQPAPISTEALNTIKNYHQHSKNSTLKQALGRLIATLQNSSHTK